MIRHHTCSIITTIMVIITGANVMIRHALLWIIVLHGDPWCTRTNHVRLALGSPPRLEGLHNVVMCGSSKELAGLASAAAASQTVWCVMKLMGLCMLGPPLSLRSDSNGWSCFSVAKNAMHPNCFCINN